MTSSEKGVKRTTSARLRSALRNATTSLTVRCLLIVLAYILAMAGLLHVTNQLANEELKRTSPYIEMFDDGSTMMQTDDFQQMGSQVTHPSALLVFDGEGKLLFSTSRNVAQKITAKELPLIAGDEDDGSMYVMLDRTDAQGRTVHEINLCKPEPTPDGYAISVKSTCTYLSDGTIVGGDLFGDKTRLTKREMSLLQGVYSRRMMIAKHSYKNEKGQRRILVLLSPTESGKDFRAAVDRSNTYRIAAVPIAVALTVLAIAVLAQVVRKSTRPLDRAIDARRSGGNAPDPSAMPVELRHTYEDFLGLMKELDQAQDDKSRMIADVSHDLKTPLSVIRGYAQAFEDGCVPQASAEKYLHAIAAKADLACELIDSLQFFAKTDHPSYQATTENRDLCEDLRLMLIDKQPDIEQAGGTLVVELPERPIRARADVELLRRAVSNVIDNAYKHNPRGVTIRVACAPTRDGALVSVADDGQGVPKDIRAHAFEPFVTSNTARSAGKGTGLGLAIASTCMQVQGGTISFAERPEAPYSTEVLMTLPPAQKD